MRKQVFILISFLLAGFEIIAGNTIVKEITSPSLRGNGMNFIENKGQIVDMNHNLRPEILYVGEGAEIQVFLRKGGISYVLAKTEGEKELAVGNDTYREQLANEATDASISSAQIIQLLRVDLDFVDCNPNATVLTSDQVEGSCNYYLSHSKGITGVRSFNRVVYQNIYPNIDIAFYGGKEQGLKYDIIVRPGGNPNDIKIKYTGADDVKVIDSKLTVTSFLGTITEDLPKVYQNIDGKILDVKAEYKLDATMVSLRLATYNLQHPLIIDPWANWITYYGGSASDNGHAITVDNAGNVLLVGATVSSNFPVSPGAFQTLSNSTGQYDGIGFIVKFDANGGRQWATYYPDDVLDVATDNSGNVLITGRTNTGVPITPGAFQTTIVGSMDAYVSKFDASGILVWSTYFGGSSADAGIGIAADATDAVVISGYTYYSTDLPVTSGAFQPTHAGGTSDAFVAKFNVSGSLQWATYYGGNGMDNLQSIAIDATNAISIAGNTASTNLPITAGAFQGTLRSNIDLFVAQFNSSGALSWATYYGGNVTAMFSYSLGMSLAIGNANSVIVTGTTGETDFPVTLGGAYKGGNSDIFVIKFSSTGTRLWATFLGSGVLGGLPNDWDQAPSCSADEYGNTYVYWEVEDKSPGWTFPCGFQKTFGGHVPLTWPAIAEPEDQIITKFGPNGNQLCNTYIGGNREEDIEYSWGGKIACYKGFVYVTTVARGFFPVTSGAYQTSFAGPSTKYGEGDATIAKICGLSCGDPSPLNIQATASQNNVCPNIPISFTGTWLSCVTSDTVGSTYQWTFSGANTSTSTLKNPTNISYPGPGNYTVKLVVHTPCGDDSLIKPNYITITPCGLTLLATGQSVCAGGCATVSASASNGTAPYTYSWSNGNTSQNINVCPTVNTTYTVVARDAIGITTTSTATVVVGSLLSATGSPTHVSCNGGNNGVAVASPGGGTAPYTYQWSNNQSTSQISNLTSQIYTVTITDALGCITNTVVSITEPLALSLTTNTTTANCNQGSGIASVNLLGGTGPYFYLWSTNSTTQQISNLSSATYSVTVTDNNGCTITSALTVGNMPGVTAQLSASSSASCYGSCTGTASVSGSGGTTPYTYLWSNGVTNGLASNLCGTAYTATITDAAGCFSTANVTITEPAPLQIQSTTSDVLCNGDNTGIASINTSGGILPYTYSWLPVINSQSSVNGLSAGNYTVAIIDALGCNTYTVISITEPPALSYTIVTSDETCGQNNGTATIHTTGGIPTYFFYWNIPGNDSALTGQAGGTYSVTIVDNNGCSIQTSATINNTGNPATTLRQPYLCAGSNYTLPDGSITSTSGIYSHTLNTIGGCDSVITTQLNIGSPINIMQSPSICSGSPFILPLGAVVSTGGTYKDTLTAIGGCDSIITTNLSVYPSFSISQNTSICAGSSYTLPNGNITSTGGIYTYSFTTTNGCDSTITINLTVNNIATGNQVLASACDSVLYNSQWYYTTQSISDTLVNGSYLGCDSITITSLTINLITLNFQTITACNNYTNNSQTYTTSGIYTQTLISASGGCDSILTINLTISNSISTTDSLNICSGQSATIHSISRDTAGTYTQTFFAAGGCDSTSSVTLFIEASPLANAGNDTTILSGQAIALTASGAGEYLWSTGQTTITINPQLTTTTTYILTVTDNNGCASTDTVTIFIDNPCDDNTEVFVPNSFSPNGDGQNDVLQLFTTNNLSPFGGAGGGLGAYFAIYNRWGERVFECSDLASSWNGTYRNKPCDTAVFTFILKITCKEESTQNIKTGNISLLR